MEDKKAVIGRILTIAGLTISVVIFCGLAYYGDKYTDIGEILLSMKSGWFIAAVLCMPAYWIFDSLIFFQYGNKEPYRLNHRKSFIITFLGEFYYAVMPAGGALQIKLLSDYGIKSTDCFSIYMAKSAVYRVIITAYGLAAILFKYLLFKESTSWFLWIAVAAITINVIYMAMLFFIAVKPQTATRICNKLLRLILKFKFLKKREIIFINGMEHFNNFALAMEQYTKFRGRFRLKFSIYLLTFLEISALYVIPFFIYKGFGLSGVSPVNIIVTQALVMPVSKLIMLPGNSGGAEGSFYLFMLPVFGVDLIAPAILIWRFISYILLMLTGSLTAMVYFTARRRKSMKRGVTKNDD